MATPNTLIYLPHIHNLRDAGGFPVFHDVSSTGFVNRRTLYRSADPYAAKADDLKSLGITTIFDLRSKPEIDRAKADGKPVDMEGITRVWSPVFEEQDYSPERLAVRFKDYATDGIEGFASAYDEILASGGQAYRMIFLHLCNLAPKDAILVHCTAGKDRTGVFFAILLTFLGCSKEDVTADYSLTDVGLRKLRPLLIERIMENQGLTGAEGRAAAERAASSRSESMISFLAMLQDKWGGAEKYMRQECTLEEDQLSKLKSRLNSKVPKDVIQSSI